MSEDEGTVRIPNSLWLAHREGDPLVIAAFALFAGDEFFGGLKSLRSYERTLGVSRRKVQRLLDIWLNHKSTTCAPEALRKSTTQVPDLEEESGEVEPETLRKSTTSAPEAHRSSFISTTDTTTTTTTNTDGGDEVIRKRDRHPVDLLWPRLQEAAKKYGKDWRKLSHARLKLINARMREGATEDDLVAAIHGAVVSMGEAREGFDPSRFITPETIYRPSNFDKYMEAAPSVQAKAEGSAAAAIAEFRKSQREEGGDEWKH